MWIKEGVVVFILSLFGIVVHAQKLNYVQKDVSLIQLFKEIRKQTGVNVIWNEKEFNVNQKMDARFKDADLKTVIAKISVELPVTFTILGRNIVVKNREVVESKKKTIEAPVPDQPPLLNRTREFTLNPVEIVSTGYQRIPRERAAGSFDLVDSVTLNRKVTGDIVSRLEGITNGLLFNKNTLRSSSGNLDLSIRGRSTIYANDQPLIILDDFPFNGDFRSINPNDVASITLLKDAAAASIWGVRAGNGVIVISTKRGKYKQPLSLSFSSNLTFSDKPDVFYNPNYLPSSDFIDIETFLFDNGKYDAALADKLNYPAISQVVKILEKQRNGQSASVTAEQLNALRGNDIRNEELKYFYQKSVQQQYFLNMSKGTTRSNHYFSAGYDHDVLSLVNNEKNRLILNTQHSFKLFKNLELTAGLYYVKTKGKVDSTVSTNANFMPYYQFKDINGGASVLERQYDAKFNMEALANGFLDWSYRPLEELGQSPTILKGNDLRLNGGLKYNIIPELNVEIKYQYQKIDNTQEMVSGMGTYFTRSLINQYSALTGGRVTGYNIPLGEIQYQILRRAAAKAFRGQLNYRKDWSKHVVAAIAGYELSELDTQADKNMRYGYNKKTGYSASVDTLSTFPLNPSGTGKIFPHTNLFGNLDRIRSVFGNIGYTYDNKYIISGSVRMDGSNYFGVKTNHKRVPLWSVGSLWHLDKESFYKLNWLPILKFRATYGYNGNLDKGNTGVTTFKVNVLSANYTNLPYANVINIGNPELRWEKIAIANLGLDFGFKDQVMVGRLEYYFKKGTDMLGDKAFPGSTGIKVLRGNYSEMKARGLDLSLTSTNLKGELKWITNFQFSTVKDRVTLYDFFEANNIYYVGVNNTNPVLEKPVYGIYSYKWAGLDPLNGDPQGYLNGLISKDYAQILEETSIADLEYHGPARPTIFGSLNNTVSFHRFTMGINFSYKLGYYFRKNTVDYSSIYANIGKNVSNDFIQRWQKPGDELITNIPSMGDYAGDDSRDRFYGSSSVTVAKGDHIRLQDVSLSYDLDRSNWKSIPFKHLQLYLYANNLGVVWKANDFGLDPDVVPELADRFVNPLPKSFSVGVKANF